MTSHGIHKGGGKGKGAKLFSGAKGRHRSLISDPVKKCVTQKRLYNVITKRLGKSSVVDENLTESAQNVLRNYIDNVVRCAILFASSEKRDLIIKSDIDESIQVYSAHLRSMKNPHNAL